MKKVKVTPELILDEDMYGLALEALGLYAPDRAAGFTWEWFTARKSWMLIPDVEHPNDPWYKAECGVQNGPPHIQTIKLNVWRSADLRRDGVPMPHSHPWNEFTGHVLMGGYEEDRYEVVQKALLAGSPRKQHSVGVGSVTNDVRHQAGDHNLLPLTTFHEVTKVLEPGRTLSLMDCGPGRKEGWGYLDPETGLYTPHEDSPIDPRFMQLLRDRNPHKR